MPRRATSTAAEVVHEATAEHVHRLDAGHVEPTAGREHEAPVTFTTASTSTPCSASSATSTPATGCTTAEAIAGHHVEPGRAPTASLSSARASHLGFVPVMGVTGM